MRWGRRVGTRSEKTGGRRDKGYLRGILVTRQVQGTRDDVRALHLSRARGMWTEVRGKGTRKGPEVRGGRGRTHKSAGQGKGPRPGTEVGEGDGPGPPIDDEGRKGIESRIEPSCGDLVGKLSRGGT